VIDAYALLLGSLLILSGSTGDRLGRRRTFQMGLAIFTAGSLLCSLAPTAGRLIGFRMVQGVGGSMLNPVSLSIIRNVFTDDRARARAMGVWAGVFGLSFATGPLVGGLLIGASAGWRSIFWVNVPVGVAALTLTPRFVHESRAARPRRLDPGGQVLVIAMLASLTYAIIEGPQVGWTAPLILAAFTLALLALTGVVIDESRLREPLLELRFFRSVPFSGATVIALCAFAAMGGFDLITTLYLQVVRGYSVLHEGLLFLPAAAAAMIFGWLVASYFVFGIGFGMVSAPINDIVLRDMPSRPEWQPASSQAAARWARPSASPSPAGPDPARRTTMMWGTTPRRRSRWLDGSVGNSRTSSRPRWRRGPRTVHRELSTIRHHLQVVALVGSSGKSIGEISRDLDLTETAARECVRRAEVDGGTRDGLTTAAREEIIRLRRQVRVLEVESTCPTEPGGD
jgi:MFS family permease